MSLLMGKLSKFFASDHPYSELLNLAIGISRRTRAKALESVQNGTGLGKPRYTTPDGSGKQILTVDQAAEDETTSYLCQRLGDNGVRVLGEETLWRFKNLDLSMQHLEGYGINARVVDGPESRLVALIDMIDGSDLVERNFGNWCSAMIFFQPSKLSAGPRILCSMVHHADGSIYVADELGAFVLPPRARPGEMIPIRGPERIKLMRQDFQKEIADETSQIAICFYGQKQTHFTTLPPGFIKWVNNHEARERFRIYNLAGNPMMARLANAENVHAVFEHLGQYPHDAAPGAYIALRAGGSLIDLEGRDLNEDALANMLMTPSERKNLAYVCASTRDLAIEIAKALNEAKVYFRCMSANCGDGLIAPRQLGPSPRCPTCSGETAQFERRNAALT